MIRKPLVRSDVASMLFVVVPLSILIMFFLAPIASITTGLLTFDWRLLLTPFYVGLSSVVSPITVTHVGGETLIAIRGFDMGVITNSVLNALIVTLATTAIGTSVAILVGLFDFPGRRLFAALAMIPLLVAPFVNAYVVKLLYGFNLQGNTVSAVLEALGLHVKIGVAGLAGVALTQILSFYTIVYVNVLATLRAVDATLIEQAVNLGSRGFKLVRSVVLPLIAPGVFTGATLAYMLSLEDVGGPIVFSFRKVISYQVYLFFRQYALIGGGGSAAALSLLMLLLAVIPMIFLRRYLSLRYYAMLTRGAPRPLRRIKLGWLGKVVAYLVVLPILVAAAAPEIGIFVLALCHRWVGPFPTGFTLNNYAVLFSEPGVFRGIENSLIYVAIAATAIAFLGFSAGYAIARVRSVVTPALDALSITPLAVPGLVMAFGYFVFLHGIARGTPLDPLISPAVVLVIAYIVRKMPFTVRSVFAGLLQIPSSVEEAAQCLGARRLRIVKNIVLPLAWRSLAAGLLLSAVYILSEVSLSVTIGALGGDITSPNHCGPITFVMMSLIQSPSTIGGAQPQAVAAAMGTILMLLEALILFAALAKLGRRGIVSIAM